MKQLITKCGGYSHAITVGLIAAVAALLAACSPPDEAERLAEQGLPPADFVASVGEGRTLYGRYCGECHGMVMKGTKKGPPLLHKYYAPGHHGDLSFYRAVKFGVQAHHWQFGDMEPMPEVTPQQVGHIVAYVRERQQRVGIN